MDTFEKAVRVAQKKLHSAVRAAMKEAKKYMPPIVFHEHTEHSAERDGELMRCLVGVEGILKRVDIFVEELPEKAIPVSIMLIDPIAGKSSVEKNIKVGHNSIGLELPVGAACRLVVHSQTFLSDVHIASVVVPNQSAEFMVKEIEDEGE